MSRLTCHFTYLRLTTRGLALRRRVGLSRWVSLRRKVCQLRW